MLVKNIEITTPINASGAQVFKILADFKNYPEWTSFIKLIVGELKEANHVIFYAKLLNGFRMPFRAKIEVFNVTEQSLEWSGVFLHSKLFIGRHYFMVKEISSEKSLLVHGESYSGVLLPLFQWLIRISKPSYEKFNLDLKIMAEK